MSQTAAYEYYSRRYKAVYESLTAFKKFLGESSSNPREKMEFISSAVIQKLMSEAKEANPKTSGSFFEVMTSFQVSPLRRGCPDDM
jgi:hypothetical protein